MKLLRTKFPGVCITFLVIMVLLGYFYWPAMLIAMLMLAFINSASAIIFGLLLDLIYGPPPENFLPFTIHIPFTILAVLIVIGVYLYKNFVTAGEGRIKVGR